VLAVPGKCESIHEGLRTPLAMCDADLRW